MPLQLATVLINRCFQGKSTTNLACPHEWYPGVIMKVLLINKYFFLNGGSESYLKNLMDELEKKGHQCVPFSVNFKNSWNSVYSNYFLSPPDGSGRAQLRDMKINFKSLLSLASRSTYSFNARHKIRKLINEHGPFDFSIVINIYNYMSPSIIDELHSQKIPIIVFVTDYNMLCLNYSLLSREGACDLCIKGHYWHGIINKCVKNSLILSSVRAVGMYLHHILGIWRKVNHFIVPCRFMQNQLIRAGYNKDSISTLKYPVLTAEKSYIKKDYILYFGRISPEKGVETLIKACMKINSDIKLYIAGRDYNDETNRLKAMIDTEHKNNVKFLGFIEGDNLKKIIGEAIVTVVPSIWHDNAPLAVLESYAEGTPVIGSDMGGIPETISNNVDGLIFKHGDDHDLASKLLYCLENKQKMIEWGKIGRQRIIENNNINIHVESIIKLAHQLTTESNTLQVV